MSLAASHDRTARRAEEGARLVLRGILLNAVLAVVKFAGGILGNTYALIADGAESLLDIHTSSEVRMSSNDSAPSAISA